jgi:hypothetical protein
LLGVASTAPHGRCKLMVRSAISEIDYLGFDE